MKQKTVTLKKAAVLSNNKLRSKIVVDTSKVDQYERRRQKRSKHKER
jgi:hypothetical protein